MHNHCSVNKRLIIRVPEGKQLDANMIVGWLLGTLVVNEYGGSIVSCKLLQSACKGQILKER
jgi:hypothetical protein